MGFGVWGLGFGVWGLGFEVRVWGLGFRVWVLDFWVMGFRAEVFGSADKGSGLAVYLTADEGWHVGCLRVQGSVFGV